MKTRERERGRKAN